MLYFIDPDTAVIDAVTGRSELSPLDITLGIDLARSNEDVLICVVQIECDLCPVERVINGDCLVDRDITVLNVILNDIDESGVVVKSYLLGEVFAVGTSCPSGRSCIGISDRSISVNCIGDELSDLVRDFFLACVLNSKLEFVCRSIREYDAEIC